jgi:acyl-CoA synthetase (AMP-forming)/AMP-acid ligase II
MFVENIYTHARRMPDKVAVIYGEHQLSYREFACAIVATRRYLRALGLADKGVAVLAIASILDDWVAGLALRSLGITTVGVRSAEQLSQLGLPETLCVVTSEIEHLPGVETLCTVARWRHVSLPSAIYHDMTAPAASDMPDPAAREGGHIMLTSGTTGHYKKVLIDPDCYAFRVSCRKSEISSRSVFNMTNHHSSTGAGHLAPLAIWDSGGTVVFQEVNLFAPLLDVGVTDAICSPWTLAQAFAASGEALRRDDAMRLIVGGGLLSSSMAEEIRARLTRQIYTNAAATEVGSFAVTPVEGPDDLRWHRILPSREVQIVDAEDHVLPAGQEGRLRVRICDGLNGYLYDEEASRTFFRDGYFYTGDLGVIRADGRLALLGRVTDVVNVLGSKFAPGPIEEAVRREFGVSGACVFSVQQADGEEIVHIAIESRQRIDLDRLAKLLGTMLPSPLHAPVHLLDALPRNHMGKVQRDVLKQQLGVA